MKTWKNVIFDMQRFFSKIEYNLLESFMIFRQIAQKLEPAECFQHLDLLFRDIRVLENKTLKKLKTCQ